LGDPPRSERSQRQRVSPEGPGSRVGKNRLHFDLYTNDQAGEFERLLGIGATRHPRTPEPGEDFTVLADPEGNLFCVINTASEADDQVG
jgi:hypothetical protein